MSQLGPEVQIQSRGWQTPPTHAPQSHWKSALHLRCRHPCPLAAASQSVLTGHSNPFEQWMGAQPCGSVIGPGAQE